MMLHALVLLLFGIQWVGNNHTWAQVIVSIESAITSLDCKEKRIPGPPMVIPSETPSEEIRVDCFAVEFLTRQDFMRTDRRVLPSQHSLPLDRILDQLPQFIHLFKLVNFLSSQWFGKEYIR